MSPKLPKLAAMGLLSEIDLQTITLMQLYCAYLPAQRIDVDCGFDERYRRTVIGISYAQFPVEEEFDGVRWIQGGVAFGPEADPLEVAQHFRWYGSGCSSPLEIFVAAEDALDGAVPPWGNSVGDMIDLWAQFGRRDLDGGNPAAKLFGSAGTIYRAQLLLTKDIRMHLKRIASSGA